MLLTCNPNNAGSYWHFENFIRRMVPWQPTHIELFQKECVLVHSTLFDNIHLANKDAYIANLKASCNYDTAKIQSEVYGSWGAVSGSFFSHVWDKNRIMVCRLGWDTHLGGGLQRLEPMDGLGLGHPLTQFPAAGLPLPHSHMVEGKATWCRLDGAG
jgi:hypothetical protein